MPSRTPLPPPPPPSALRSWPDEGARLADRERAVGELSARLLGGRRLGGYLLVLTASQAGGGVCGLGLVAVLDGFHDTLTKLVIALVASLGLVGLGLAVWGAAAGAGRDRVARRRLLAWAALEPVPVRDPRLRAPGLSLVWLLLGFAQCAGGLWLCFAVPAAARPGSTTFAEVVHAMGAGLILWVNGLLGVGKAAGHYRVAVRLGAPAKTR
ncbi:hypothetical protein [Streptomyces sp. ODS05-4]|uniref:hypothetical protein n=1 Tax=Streptomyces sp. ODS05-4 TaxID=2944939 RepID=UPI00210C986E|nr:hypothetical protein [Streptomyces sp. ODS05-4]